MKEYFLEAETLSECWEKALFMESVVWASRNRDDLNEWVYVKHSDGSACKARYAFLRFAKWQESNVVIVYPEHLKPMLFCVDDLDYIYTVNEKNKEWIYIDEELKMIEDEQEI